MATVEVGQRVVRSATWTSGDQDGGEGHLGTVVKLKDQDPQDPIPSGWAKIRWDNGNVNNYQVGSSGSYDLALFDSAPAGVIHVGIVCDSCSVNPIAGIRWKCSDQSCPDYDLCTPCYMNDKHDLTHTFTRFTSRKETGTPVTPRFGEAKTVSRGLCPGAEVCRGKDWQGDDKDGDSGTMVEICPFSERPRSGVTVCWTQSKLLTTHRVGFDGKMDLKCTTAGTGIGYYATHLPVLGKEVGLKVGDLVAITLDRETLQIMQQMDGREWLPEMGNLYGKVAKVTGINLNGNAEVNYPGKKEQPFTFNPDVLNKVPRLGKGDRVQINKDLTFVMNLQENSQNGWVDGMEKRLGMEGTVMNVDSRYNSRVRLIGLENIWSWHPCCLVLVKKNSSDDDEQGAESLGLKLDGSGHTEMLKALLSRLKTEANSSSDSDSDEEDDRDRSGQTKMLKALLSLLKTKAGSSSDSDSGEGDEESQLIKAAKRGKVERVVEILSTSPEKANAKVGGKTALHLAAAHGHLKIVQALLESGAEIEITTDDGGNTPLIYSVEGDEPAITKYLIGKGADINRGNDNGRRAIHQAAYKGLVDCARVLINHGCDVNVQDTEKDTPLHDAIMKSRLDVIELLVKVPDLDVTIPDERGFTALQFAALKDKPEAAELIARSFPRSIVVAKDDGFNILHICAVNNHVEVMKAVMAMKDHGLDVNAKESRGLTALHLAANDGYSHCIEFLMSQGADINLRGQDDHTALHILASTAGKDPSDIKDTPTLRKIRKRFRDCGVDNSAAAALCYMVLKGASIDLENVKCRTPLYYIRNAELKKTLKKIAREKTSDDMSSWEDLGEDEDVKKGRLSSNSVNVDDDDIIIKRNDGLSGADRSSPNQIRQDSAESESGADGPAGNQKKTYKPKIEVFDLVHKIEVSDLDMGPVVGKGQFGVVHRASWRGTPVAVKKISMMGSRKDEIEKEVAIHRRASHPNIVQMMALGYQGREAFLVMQFIEGPSLHTVIFPDRDDVKIPLDWAKKLQISCEVLQAVTFMHACNILHLDIKPANILVDSAIIRPYICDLGLAHIKNRNLMSQSAVNIRGTLCFMPPEALGATEPGYRHSNKHDIWSVAGTLVELYSMKRLWGDSVHPVALMARILTGQMGKPESLTAVDSKVQKILEPCFEQKPEKRPSASDLLDHFNDLT